MADVLVFKVCHVRLNNLAGRSRITLPHVGLLSASRTVLVISACNFTAYDFTTTTTHRVTVFLPLILSRIPSAKYLLAKQLNTDGLFSLRANTDAAPMSNYNQYADYGGNPYNNGSNPYASGPDSLTASHPTPAGQYDAPAPTQHATTGSARAVLSTGDFLSRVEGIKADIRTLTTYVGQIASMHQRALSSPDASSSGQLESVITQTQVLNTHIKDQIKFLETDAARSGGDNIKTTQVAQLKGSFKKQLQEYRQEEANYEKRYKEQIGRQYRIVNPDATDAEVQEATEADWGNEGVFQQAVSTWCSLLAAISFPKYGRNDLECANG